MTADFVAGLTLESLLNLGWMLPPEAKEGLRLQPGEPLGMVAGRITADLSSIAVGIVGIDTGIPLIEGGAAGTVLSDGTLVLVGGGAVVVGGVLVLEGAGTAVSGAINLGQNVSAFAGDGRSKRNDVQNKQFAGAVRQLERELGRKLSRDHPDEVNELHRELHNYSNPGFWDIVEAGLKLFWRDD